MLILQRLRCTVISRYGYSFGTAAADVWHLTDHTAMLYPSYLPFTAAGMLLLCPQMTCAGA